MDRLIPIFTTLALAIGVVQLLITLFGALAGLIVAVYAAGVVTGYALPRRKL